jgi:hypothetical protein
MRDAVRAVVWGVVGGLIVTIIAVLVGARDPLSLLLTWLVGAVVVGVIFELYQIETVSRHLPYVLVGVGNRQRLLAREPDALLAQRVDAVVKGINDLMATHIRNEPDFHAGGDIQEWQQQQDRRGRHERNTTGRFFEQYGREILDIAEALKRRAVLTEDEHRTVVWTFQTAGYSMVHELPRIAAQFAAASRKLRGQD